MFNFLHTFRPEPIIFSIGNLQVHWYAVLMIIGGLAGFFVVSKLAEKYNIAKSDIEEFLIYFVIGAVVLARLYYVIYAWDYYSKNLLDIFKIWEGGLAIYGAMITGLLVLFLYHKKFKLNFLLLLDLIVIALAIGLSFGRWGNYFNQELFGLPTNLPWGIPIDEIHRPVQYLNFQYFHPTFIYESLTMFFTYLLLVGLHWLRIKGKQIRFGLISLTFFTIYGIERFLNEMLRQDFSPFVLGLRINQLVSILIICISLFLWLYYLINKHKE